MPLKQVLFLAVFSIPITVHGQGPPNFRTPYDTFDAGQGYEIATAPSESEAVETTVVDGVGGSIHSRSAQPVNNLTLTPMQNNGVARSRTLYDHIDATAGEKFDLAPPTLPLGRARSRVTERQIAVPKQTVAQARPTSPKIISVRSAADRSESLPPPIPNPKKQKLTPEPNAPWWFKKSKHPIDGSSVALTFPRQRIHGG